MLVNLSDVFSSEGKTATITAQLEMTEFASRLGRFFISLRQDIINEE